MADGSISEAGSVTPARKAGMVAGSGWPLLSIGAFFLFWEVCGRIPVSQALPPFSDVVAAFFRLAASGELAAAYGETLPPLLLGLLVSSLLGVALGVAMGLLRSAEWLFYPVLVILQTAPVAAVIPLITYAYGIGTTAKVVAVLILAAPMVALNCYTGIRHTSASLVEMCRAFGGSERQLITKIILPHASSMIVAGLRLGVSGGFIGIVLAELLITPTGIGDLISYYRSRALYAEMHAAIVSIIALATITLALLQTAERHYFPTRTVGDAL